MEEGSSEDIMLSQSISSMESFASLAVVFTLHRLVSLSSVPELLPAMPPELWSPEITPAAEQPEISPDFSFTPAIPPTLLVPLTFPEKVHPVILPELLPAIPPTYSALPSGDTVPFTVRSLTSAPRCTYRKSPE